jgi:superfamily II DNA or RNA helicase
MSPITITERFLMDTGGWPAMKHAKALVEMGRVISVKYQPPVLQGVVREGDTEYRAGLKIEDYSRVENLCSCRESRQWGKICAHSLAIGLASIRPRTPAKTEPQPGSSVPKGPTLLLAGPGEQIQLFIVIAPTFLNSWDKNQIMVGFEIFTRDTRTLASALPENKQYVCSAEDKEVLDGLRGLFNGKLPGMASLSRNDFLDVLRRIQNHPRVSLGRMRQVTVESTSLRPPLLVEQLPGGRLRISAKLPDNCSLLAGERSAWLYRDQKFVPVAAGLPTHYLPMLTQPVVPPTEQGLAFVQNELPGLKVYFAVPENPTLPEVRPGDPAVVAAFEGSLNHLKARVQCFYGKRIVTAGLTPASDFFVYEDNGPRSRNLKFEAECLERLQSVGFQVAKGSGELVLRGQNGILHFFASVLPELRKIWKVSIGSRFEHVTESIEKITPRFEITGSGEDWFDLSFSLATSSGERFSAADIQRLLRLGQSFTRLRNGATAVFNEGDLAEVQNALTDCSPDQVSPGRYRISRAQAGFLDGVLSSFGSGQIIASSGWRDWAQRQQQLKPIETVPLASFDEVLRPYQKQGVYWMHFIRQNRLGGILADEMGLGKTVQCLAFLSALPGPALVVCPASLLFNWRREIDRFAPQLKVLTIEGANRAKLFGEIDRSDLVLTSYPLLRRDSDLYRRFEFETIVLDEANHIKNPDTQNAQAAAALRGKHRFVLTGTPVENSVRDLWSIMNFVLPGYLGARSDFRDRYELPISRGSEAEKVRLAKRIRPVMLRRLKREVARELPDKIEQVSFCELSSEQRELYQKVHSEARRQLNDLSGEKDRARARMTMLTTLLRLRQVCCDVRLVGQEGGSGKMEMFLELLEEVIDGGHRVLVFSQFVQMLHLLREELQKAEIDFCYLDGQTKDRQFSVDRFQNESTIPVFLISLKAGGVGLNLTGADTIFHFDPWWNPAVEDQATDRAHRLGQERTVTSYKFISRGTVEEKILALQQKKRAIIDATVESEEPVMTGLSTQEIVELISGEL